MKKKIASLILALASLSAIAFWLLKQRSHQLVLPMPAALEAKLMQDDALLACTNMHTSFIKNPWGDLGISTGVATISRTHVIRASSVQIKQAQGSISAHDMLLDVDKQELSFTGNVQSEIDLSREHRQQP